ncbi:MAG: transposase [Verrucomicrobiaceae bacterium]|nr:transposase [Verrucomicrobiaceae bacterium]
MPERIIEIDLPEEEWICPTTGAVRALIRWEETIKINYVPGYFERLIIRRAVRAVKMPADGGGDLLPESPVVTAEMPAEYRVIPGAVATAGLLAWLIVSKYCDHLPFYRQQQIFKRQHKVNIDRNMMCHWMKRCCIVLGILYEAMRVELLSGNYLQIDERSAAT